MHVERHLISASQADLILSFGHAFGALAANHPLIVVSHFHGQLLLIWVATYPIARSIIEAFRGDVERGLYFGLSTSQWISLAVAAFAIWLYVYLWFQILG